MKTPSLRCSAVLLTGLLFAQAAVAQVPVSVGSYVQNFDSLASSGSSNPWSDNVTLPGWITARTNGVVSSYAAGAGTSTSSGLYSFGAAASSDRALGSIGANSFGSVAYAVVFTNDTGEAQTDITISYTGEQWRNGGNTSQQQYFFDYAVSSTSIPLTLDFFTPWYAFSDLEFLGPTFSSTAGALDGNNPTNRQEFSNIVLSGVTLQPGELLYLRWVDINDSGNDHALAIDDLTVVFPGVVPVINPPEITVQPQSRTNNAGTSAAFSVTLTGTQPFGYQWRRDGAILSDADNIVGSQNGTLTISSLKRADEASFDVIITNMAGAVTSMVATLTVIDPAINAQPFSRTNVPGDFATFSVTAGGTTPLHYQWRLDEIDIPGATRNSYQITNVTPGSAGTYSVLLTNEFGSALSSNAVLTVLPTPAARFAHWDFNNTGAPSTTNEPAIAFGTGSASVIGGTIGAFVSGGPTDPAPSSTNSGWNTSAYPTQGSSNKSAGVQFAVSTVGYTNILVTWQERHSGTASKYVRLQYSLNGSDFVDQNGYTLSADSVFVQFTSDLSGIPGAANNPNFAFRIVSEWESTATDAGSDVYRPTFSGGSYSVSGTIRFDMVNLFGDPLGVVVRPEIDEIRVSGAGVTVDFTAGAGDAASAFTVVRSGTVNGTYTDAPASIVSLGAGKFRATLSLSGIQQFYQIKR